MIDQEQPESRSPWLLRDAAAALALLILWRYSTFLWPTALAGLPNWVRGALFLLGPQLFYLLVPVGLLRLRGDSGVLTWPSRSKLLAEAALSFVILAAVIAILGVLLLVGKLLLPDVSFVPSTFRHRASSLSPQEVWLIFTFSVLVAPICEETFFRAYLHGTLRSRMPRSLAGMMQSCIFALMHNLDPILTPASFAVGVFLTVIYEWRRSLLSPIFLHAGLNVLSGVTLLLMTTGTRDRPILGVGGQDHPDGCEITDVIVGSPAATASLEPGDVIKTFDGHRVRGFVHLVELLRSKNAGERVTLVVGRSDTTLEFHVTLQPRGPRAP